MSNFSLNNSGPRSVLYKNLLVVDPNASGRNMVNTEDLNISVELEVFKRDEDIIVFSENNVETDNSNFQVQKGNDIDTTLISFIDGSSSEKKYLTTHYTELNSSFNKENEDLGTLGIESIDISFNSSYVPIVKIKFKDIRGKLFEMGDDSPYNFLFRMPYPIFYLTIKGYYGKPVKYALHLTKFSGSLNSDSGDFIIDCDFIGYSYAFLTDILMGLIKSIPFTETGLSLKGDDFVTFDELMDIVSRLETYVNEYKKNDVKLKALNVYSNLLNKLDEIIGTLPSLLKFNGDNPTTLSSTSSNISELVSYTKSSDTLSYDNINNYEEKFLKLLNSFNELITDSTTSKDKISNSFKINVDEFDLGGDISFYKSFKLSDFLTFSSEGEVTGFKDVFEFQDNINLKKYSNFKLKKGVDGDYIDEGNVFKLYNDFKNDILKQPPFYNDGKFISTSQEYNIMDLRFIDDKLLKLKNEINKQFKTDQNKVVDDFSLYVSTFFKGLPYDGSIGKLFKILCEHVDLFINSLRSLGTKINEDKKNGKRRVTSSNLKNLTTVSSGDVNISAFPEYVEDDGNGNLVEKWLGDKFPNFKEVTFVDDLFNKVISQSIKESEFIENLEKKDLSWYPVNPLETTAFNSNNINPWENIKNSNELIYYKTLIQRMVIFMSYSNKTLSKKEITNMAKIEANQAFLSSENKKVKDTIIEADKNSKDIILRIKELSNKVKAKYKLFLDSDDDDYIYVHGENLNGYGDSPTYIPLINKDNSKTNGNDLVFLSNRKNSTTFISDVISNDINKNIGDDSDSYETYIRVIDDLEYSNISENFNNFINDTSINDKNSILGGKLKTREFIKHTKKGVGEIPLFYEFYDDSDEYTFVDVIKNDRTINTNQNTFNFNTMSNLKKINKVKSIYSYITENDDNKFVFNSTFNVRIPGSSEDFSLFGSKFYYEQNTSDRALLFLHSLPFKGLGKGSNDGLLENDEIKFFNESSGFVSAPYPWLLFLGGMLKRFVNGNTIKTKNVNDSNGLIPMIPSGFNLSKDEYLMSKSFGFNSYRGLSFGIRRGDGDLVSVNKIITSLPTPVKNVLISEFDNWVKTGWLDIKNKLEIFKEGVTSIEIDEFFNNFNLSSPVLNSETSLNYDVLLKTKFTGNFILNLRLGEASKSISDFILTNKIIINSTYRIWVSDDTFDDENYFSSFKMNKSDVDDYITTFFKEFSKLNKQSNNVNQNSEARIRSFNNNNIEDIKLSIYKNLKSVYDKWVVGIPQNTPSVIVDNLFKRFNFIDRAFNDISEEVKIAPTTFKSLWEQNSNVNFYNFIANILKDNNFDFIPLPTYINYNSPKEVSDVFRTFDYNTVTNEGSRGPQFVCMYFGERSNKLKLNKDSSFKDDSFSLDVRDRDLEDATLVINEANSNLPSDFKDGNTKVPYVIVNYADQNQSIFKNFKLDQNEFTETQESLAIIERLSYGNKNASIGQNLFDIYNNRAYSAEIEMLGCAQIQPFMFFQLNNIPMFNGAYSIINTRHHIKANHMTTTFKGVRVRAVKTKMIDIKTLYSHLISDLSDINSNGGNLQNLRNVNFNAAKLLTNSTLGIPDKLLGKFINPLPGEITVTSSFGARTVKGKFDYHGGTDFRALTPTDVIAITDMLVTRVKFNSKSGSSGLYIEFKVDPTPDNSEIFYVRFMHLSELTHPIFKGFNLSQEYDTYEDTTSNKDIVIGKKIKQGEVFAKTGKTGTSQPHLHMDIRNSANPLDDSGFKATQIFFKPELVKDWKFKKNQNKRHDN